MPSASPGDPQPLRLACVDRNGFPCCPQVGNLTAAGVELWHHQSGQNLLLPWPEFLHEAARACAVSPVNFARQLADLARELEEPLPLPLASIPLSGPSAPCTTERRHGPPRPIPARR